jgi:hypothetical protein
VGSGFNPADGSVSLLIHDGDAPALVEQQRAARQAATYGVADALGAKIRHYSDRYGHAVAGGGHRDGRWTDEPLYPSAQK